MVRTLVGSQFGPPTGKTFSWSELLCSRRDGLTTAEVTKPQAGGAPEHCPSGYCGPKGSEGLSSLGPFSRSLLPSRYLLNQQVGVPSSWAMCGLGAWASGPCHQAQGPALVLLDAALPLWQVQEVGPLYRWGRGRPSGGLLRPP